MFWYRKLRESKYRICRHGQHEPTAFEIPQFNVYGLVDAKKNLRKCAIEITVYGNPPSFIGQHMHLANKINQVNIHRYRFNIFNIMVFWTECDFSVIMRWHDFYHH